MIATLTPNPSLDRTMVVGHLTRGAVIRAKRDWIEPAGKGINISRALWSNGIKTTAAFPSGGINGQELCRLLDADGVDYVAVPIAGSVRSNVSVVEPDGTVTKLNESGPTVTMAEVKALTAAAIDSGATGGWLVASGSLAPGMPADFYSGLAQGARTAGMQVAIDSSGPPLLAALAGKPTLVKPNRHELSELLDVTIGTLGDVIDAAQQTRKLGADQVLVSLGPDGAVLVDSAGAVHGEVLVDKVRNTVGAGDALLAGFLAGGGTGIDGLRTALAWSRAAVMSPLTLMGPPGAADRAAVTVHKNVVADRPLSDDEASRRVASNPDRNSETDTP